MKQEKNETGFGSFGRKLGARIGINRSKPTSSYLVRSESFVMSYSPPPKRKMAPSSNRSENKTTSSNSKICLQFSGNDKFIGELMKNDLSVVHEDEVFPPY